MTRQNRGNRFDPELIPKLALHRRNALFASR